MLNVTFVYQLATSTYEWRVFHAYWRQRISFRHPTRSSSQTDVVSVVHHGDEGEYNAERTQYDGRPICTRRDGRRTRIIERDRASAWFRAEGLPGLLADATDLRDAALTP
jgi:hypothetical protein